MHTSSGLFLSQLKYVTDLLRKFQFHMLKFVYASCVSRTTISLTDGELLSNPSDYRCMVGVLHYLIMTRPNITCVVQVASQFMHPLRTTHMNVVKRIFKFLQAIADHGLFFKPNSRLDLMVALCYFDWVRCPNSNHSNTKLAIFLSSNLISWGSKK